MKLVYVAGPFRGRDSWEISKNVRRAEELAAEVWKLGAVAICPHKNTENFQGMLPDAVFIEGTLAMLKVCHAMIVVPNYQRSDGTKGEIEFAKEHHIPVFYSVFQLKRWIAEASLPRELNGN